MLSHRRVSGATTDLFRWAARGAGGVCDAVAPGAVCRAAGLDRAAAVARRRRGRRVLRAQRDGDRPLARPFRLACRAVPARPCLADIPAVPGRPGFRHRAPAAGAAVPGDALDRPRQPGAGDLVRRLAARLGRRAGGASDHDTWVVPPCRAAVRLGEFPRRRLEPEHRVAVLRPARRAGGRPWAARARRPALAVPGSGGDRPGLESPGPTGLAVQPRVPG